jgi:hypothetical protein
LILSFLFFLFFSFSARGACSISESYSIPESCLLFLSMIFALARTLIRLIRLPRLIVSLFLGRGVLCHVSLPPAQDAHSIKSGSESGLQYVKGRFVDTTTTTNR